jgi:DNA-binding XRE family transcriptional regulator
MTSSDEDAAAPQRWATLEEVEREFSTNPEYRVARAEADQRGERRRAAYGLALSRLRKARALTQTNLALHLGVAQAEVSRIEHQTDMLASTLASYVEAMGGKLSLLVRFPDQEPVELEIEMIAGTLSQTA